MNDDTTVTLPSGGKIDLDDQVAVGVTGVNDSGAGFLFGHSGTEQQAIELAVGQAGSAFGYTVTVCAVALSASAANAPGGDTSTVTFTVGSDGEVHCS